MDYTIIKDEPRFSGDSGSYMIEMENIPLSEPLRMSNRGLLKRFIEKARKVGSDISYIGFKDSEICELEGKCLKPKPSPADKSFMRHLEDLDRRQL